jgi:signal transduction histidine kinase
MQDISLHILDIVENSVKAKATKVEIKIVEDDRSDLLTVEIRDNGQGMDKKAVKKALDPFYTTKSEKRIGLGISLLAQAAREGGGNFAIESEPDSGTSIVATFMLSHPDRKPLGDVKGTVHLLQLTHPDIIFDYDFLRK